ncbi:MAG TPA: choice-of-anchor D domain-containing protein, partial [Ignavibacteriaceae bacterium]|nr:choice-of-anchor D domain-containing protein [Ignavibacteriaceae bacterium]
MKTYALLVVSLFIFSSISFSQIQLMSSGYSQDFNTLSDTGSSTQLPGGWYLLETGTNADGKYNASTGSTTGGNTYSFGSSGSSERALGSIRSGSLIPFFGINLLNNTGDIISALHISYTGEQWRVGANRPAADRLDFQYSLNASNLSDGDWMDVDQLDFYSPKINSSTGALDGNLPENQNEITYTITGLSISSGGTFWLKWSDPDASGNDDGLAIDDFSVDLTTPPVIFSIVPSSLNFGTVDIGNSSSLSVSVENQGTRDNLLISNIESSNPVFTFSAAAFPISIPPGDSQSFNITFTPVTAGAVNGTINFTHNAEGSYYSLPVSGTGRAPAQGGILRFKSALRDLTEGTINYRDTIVLSAYSGRPLKAMQFNLLAGRSIGGLKLTSVSRGNAVPADLFNFSYEIYPGTLLSDSSSIDTVRVVILGNGTNVINPGAGNQDIMYFTYNTVNISVDSLRTFNGLTGVKGATSAPVADANLSAGADEIINISVLPPEKKFGDINLDDHVDILDILLMIDCILGREALSTDQFIKGDIFPWTIGEAAPAGDGIIDVLDLALLHNIVLTGVYPDDMPVPRIIMPPIIAAGAGVHNEADKAKTKVIFNFSREGISISLESVKKIKGLQAELANLGSLIPENTAAASSFSKTDYYQNNSFLRLLAYDDKSNALDPGSHLAASIPFSLINPEKLTVENIIVADEMNRSVPDVEIEIQYKNPDIPLNYTLSQNYPNPFNPGTTIRFSIAEAANTSLKIFNILGQEV